MPEVDDGNYNEKIINRKKYDIISIGKTCRDNENLCEAITRTGLKACIVGNYDEECIGKYKHKNINFINKRISYNEARSIYKNSLINAVICKEARGIYGLTSILDSFTQTSQMKKS